MEFGEMTHKEIGEYIAARARQHQEEFRERAVLLDGLFRQWAATQAKHPRAVGPKQLYPWLFGEQALAPEQRRALTAQRWREFLTGER